MNTAVLKKFAQGARRKLIEQIQSKLNFVLNQDTPELRERSRQVQEIREQVDVHGEEQVIERVAYIWFNRFMALRYMDANEYTAVKTVSAPQGFTMPEILSDAQKGIIDEDLTVNRDRINQLLSGTINHPNAQNEVYKMLLVSACNYYSSIMPFMFEEIADYSELLMPDDLLSTQSIINDFMQLDEEDIAEVQSIGWMYQFYISEKKDDVFAALKKNKKVTAENIPAATQLFTPHWIVQYMVENSLGRLWMLNHPNSKLKEHMPYYIEPNSEPNSEPRMDTNEHQLKTGKTISVDPEGVDKENSSSSGSSATCTQGSAGLDNKNISVDSCELVVKEDHKKEVQEEDYIKISSPEELKICDPACGSGHILVYAFDLLTKIYEEELYETKEIPRLILEKNLFGLEIDERAAELASFALFMKARAYDRRFFKRVAKGRLSPNDTAFGQVTSNICELQNIVFDEGELAPYMDKVGVDKNGVNLFTQDLQYTLHQFDQAKNFGSLITPRLQTVDAARTQVDSLHMEDDLYYANTHRKVAKALQMADYLSPKYHCVVANPPYMGGKGMNPELANFAKKTYPDSKSDLFAMFMERSVELSCSSGYMGMINMQSWMFLSSFEKLRTKILANQTILSMAHLGPRGFDSIGGEVVQTVAFVLENKHKPEYNGAFIRLIEGRSEAEKSEMFKKAIK